jgi:cytochrome c oxidase subunit 2
MILENIVPAASSYAGQIDGVWELIFWLTGFWLLVSEGVFFWLIMKFRKKDGQAGQYITGDKKEEKRWITYPHLLVLVCDVFIVVGAVKIWYHVKQELPPAEQTVRVVSQQWAWTFEHPGPDGELGTADDIRTVNDLHVQNDTVYHYKLESKDVLHDFSVPAFRLKQDAIPGRIITGWFQPTELGTYDIQCAEICGIGHGVMGARIHVESAAEHAAWMAEHAGTHVAAASPKTR